MHFTHIQIFPEQLEITNYNNEVQRFTMKQNNNLEKYTLITKSKGVYGNYVLERLKEYTLKSLKYNVRFNNESRIW